MCVYCALAALRRQMTAMRLPTRMNGNLAINMQRNDLWEQDRHDVRCWARRCLIAAACRCALYPRQAYVAVAKHHRCQYEARRLRERALIEQSVSHFSLSSRHGSDSTTSSIGDTRRSSRRVRDAPAVAD